MRQDDKLTDLLVTGIETLHSIAYYCSILQDYTVAIVPLCLNLRALEAYKAHLLEHHMYHHSDLGSLFVRI